MSDSVARTGPEQGEPSAENGSVKITLEDIIHVGPGTICGEYLRKFWQPVYPANRLASGQALPMRILGEDFTLYRGETGDVHAVAYRCAHRGTQLSTGWVEGDCIRCLYHGWKYDQTGQCVEQPDEDPRFASRIRIRSYPVRQYIGLIFMYFGVDEPPPLLRLTNFEESDDPHHVIQTATYVWPCSFMNGLENDSYHGNWVHREQYAAIGRLPEKGGFNVEVEQTEYGFVSNIERRGARRFRRSQTHNIMPNMRMRRASAGGEGGDVAWHEAIRWSVPVDDAHFRNVNIRSTHVAEGQMDTFLADKRERRELMKTLAPAIEVAESVLRGEAKVQDYSGRLGVHDPRSFAIADYSSQVGQGPFAPLVDSHLGRGDVEVAMWRRLYRRELKALAEGRPTRNWVVPEHLSTRISQD